MQQQRHPHRLHALGLLLALVLCAAARPAVAQERVEFTAQSVEYRFSEQINFVAEFTSRPIILEGYIFYQVGDDERIWVYEGDVSLNRLDVQVTLDEQNQPQAFTSIEYWFRIASDRGEFFESPHYTFYYDDNRFAWQQVELDSFELMWHSGNSADAAVLLNAANQAVDRVQALLPLPDPQPLTLRVYEHELDAWRVAQLAGYPWEAGHMQPGQGVLLLTRDAQVERQIARELAHTMLYEGLGAQGYANLPAWLREGIASVAQGEPDPQETSQLAAALREGSLPPLYTLCGSFPPRHAAQAAMAHLQSASVVRYLIGRFNETGFGILVEAYARSGDCIQAPQAAFGVDMLQLELDWHTALIAEPPPLLANVDLRSVGGAAGVAILLWGLMRLATRAGGDE